MGAPWCLPLLSPVWSFPCTQPLRLRRAVPVSVQRWRIPMYRLALGASLLWTWSWTAFKVFLLDLALGPCRFGARTIFVLRLEPCKDGKGQLHLPQQHECMFAHNAHFVPKCVLPECVLLHIPQQHRRITSLLISALSSSLDSSHDSD